MPVSVSTTRAHIEIEILELQTALLKKLQK